MTGWIFAAVILVSAACFGAVVWFKRTHDVNRNVSKAASAAKDVVKK